MYSFMWLLLVCSISVKPSSQADSSLVFLDISSHDLERLGRGNDFRADVCGKVGTTVQDKPYLYYQDPVGSGLIGMCVEECPSSAVNFLKNSSKHLGKTNLFL